MTPDRARIEPPFRFVAFQSDSRIRDCAFGLHWNDKRRRRYKLYCYFSTVGRPRSFEYTYSQTATGFPTNSEFVCSSLGLRSCQTRVSKYRGSVKNKQCASLSHSANIGLRLTFLEISAMRRTPRLACKEQLCRHDALHYLGSSRTVVAVCVRAGGIRPRVVGCS